MRWAWIAASVLALGACLGDPTVDCGDHLCPANAVCTPGGCAQPEQLTACAGKPERAPCATPEIAAGACKAEVCLPIVCGDGDEVGPEVCDDGNQRSGDGCAADCASREVCGNRYVDPLRGEECDRGLAGLSGDGCTSTCSLEAASWRERTPRPPAARMEHAMTYDTRRERVVMVGGRASLALSETWEWDGLQWHDRQPAPAPPARTSMGLAYDPMRGVTVLFGGHGVAALDDTWEWDGIVWTERTPMTAPPARTRFAMAYDPVSSRVVVFGGRDAQAAPLADTWAWDGTTWTELPVAVHPAAGDAQLALDPVTTTLVLVSAARETWTWSGSAWIAHAGTTPLIGSGESLTRTTNGVLLFGGFFGGIDVRNKAFLWSAGTWTAVAPASPPSARYAHAAAFDEARGALVLFGGGTLSQPLDDTYLLGASGWGARPPLPAPDGGERPGLAYERMTGSLVAFGGNFRDDTWQLTDVWTPAKVTVKPTFREGMGLVAVGDRALLFGGLGLDLGCGCVTALADTWRWDGAAWAEEHPALRPPARQQAAITYDARRDRVVVFGGETETGAALGDTWEWDGAAWSEPHPAHAPSPRTGATLVFDRAHGESILFGGGAGAAALGDTWTWDGTDWTRRAPPVSPPPRGFATGAYHDGRGTVILVGGSAFDALGDAWEWDGTTWSPIAVPVELPARRSAASAYDPVHQELVVFGGTSSAGLRADAWALRFSAVASPRDRCREVDTDGDGLAGCADPDCWARCTPACSVGEPCDPAAPRCGDGACSVLEDPRLCPGDCP